MTSSAFDEDVLDLARLLHDAGFDDTAEALVVALETQQEVVGLSIEDREAIVSTLDDPPEGLSELRGILLAEHEWRMREGLVYSAKPRALFLTVAKFAPRQQGHPAQAMRHEA
jgi:hypothetical protein